MNETRPSPFFALLRFRVFILNANRRTKNGGPRFDIWIIIRQKLLTQRTHIFWPILTLDMHACYILLVLVELSEQIHLKSDQITDFTEWAELYVYTLSEWNMIVLLLVSGGWGQFSFMHFFTVTWTMLGHVFIICMCNGWHRNTRTGSQRSCPLWFQ